MFRKLKDEISNINAVTSYIQDKVVYMARGFRNIEEIARKEKEDYEKKKKDFYDNPLHWDNNKRKRHHLPVLRGSTNKNRSKRYHSFHPTAHICCLIEDVIDEVLTDNMKNNEFFGQFVDVKNIGVGDKDLFFVE